MALSWQVDAASIPDPDKVQPNLIGGKLGSDYEVWRPLEERDVERADRETSSAVLTLGEMAADADHLRVLLATLLWRDVPMEGCPRCPVEVPVRPDGRLIAHKDRVLTGLGYDPLPCPGGRTTHLEATDD